MFGFFVYYVSYPGLMSRFHLTPIKIKNCHFINNVDIMAREPFSFQMTVFNHKLNVMLFDERRLQHCWAVSPLTGREIQTSYFSLVHAYRRPKRFTVNGFIVMSILGAKPNKLKFYSELCNLWLQ